MPARPASPSTNLRRRRVREFHGQAAEVTPASLEDSFALVAAVDRYPDWCSDAVRAVDVLERGPDGHPSRVRMGMHIARGAVVRDFDLYLAIVVEPPATVKLTRFTDHPTNQQFHATWLLRPAGSTRIELQLDAKLRVPPYTPAGGIPDAIAEGFVGAACRALAARRPDA
jgi:ribosome-associated toxin RatA of RatAB toxin-antitoxin module